MKVVFEHPLRRVVESKVNLFKSTFGFDAKVRFDEKSGLWQICYDEKKEDAQEEIEMEETEEEMEVENETE